MKTLLQKQSLLIAFVSAWAAFGAYASTSAELLQQGLYSEEIEGDLPAAIDSYERIITDPASPQDHVVQALYRKGMCHVRLGDEKQAVDALSQLVSRYPDRTELVEQAKAMLETLSYFDPATLMSADTMVYLELGSPGRQVETLLEMFDLSSVQDPLASIRRTTGGAPLGVMEVALLRFFNPSMLTELKKVRSLAVGCPQFDPHGDSSFLCVMHPGESDALRGMVIAALGVAGRPSEPIEGMTVLQIPEGPNMAYDDKVIFIAYPQQRLVDCINQYKGVQTGPSLASGNATFRKIDKMERQHNAATLWIDVDNLYSHVLTQRPDLPPNVKMVAEVLGVAGIDDLLLSHAIKPDGIKLDATVNLNEDIPNMAYEMIRTPALTSSSLEGVPPAACFLVSMALSTNNPAQLQQLQQMLKIGNSVPLPPEFLANIEQVSLFALPGEAEIPEGMPFRPGVVLACRDKEPVQQLLHERLAEVTNAPPIQMVESDRLVILAYEQAVIDASLNASGGGPSVLEQGVLSQSVRSNLGRARKMVLVNAGGLVRLAGIQTAFHSGADDAMAEKLRAAFTDLAEQVETTTLSVYSDEQPQTLTLHAGLSRIPSLSGLMPAIGRVQAVIGELEQIQAQTQATEWAQKAQELMDLPPARIVETATAPVIDGEMDDVWNAAVPYELARTIYVNPGPDEQIAANYRMLWDAENLYVLIDVSDSSPSHNPDQIWQFNDGIELYLDATDRKPTGYGDTEYQFGLVWNANAAEALCVQEKGRTVHAIDSAMMNTEKGYCFEAAFPWSLLGTIAGAGTHIGIEVQVNDNRGRGGRDAKISWHDPYDQAWLNPQYFGRAELVEAE